MPAPRGIDWAWAVRTGGALTTRQKLQLTPPLIGAAARYAVARARLATGIRGAASLDLDDLKIPDSRLANDATGEAHDVLSPHVLQHSYRTYLFGLALAKVRGVTVDEELSYVASMLHDTQLEHPTPGRCFAVVGGERAERFALDRGVDAERAAAVGAAIAGHITVGAATDLADPAGFVSAGAWADLTGDGLHHFDADWVDAVHAHHPRHDFQRHLLQAWSAEQRAMPRGRARWMTRWGGFARLLRLAPFDE